MSALWLVQRLTREDSPRRGFDGVFRCQYMGSAEFEFGALPESLRRIRGGKKVGTSTVEVEGRTVYLYGPRANREAVAAALPEWVAAGCPGKEWSYFDRHLAGTADRYEAVDVWWAVREDVLFALDPAMVPAIEDALTR